ncbi:hypothetical protein GCM10022384_44920 [Streptomyces marokkonensis]|uniref:Uncharacterized protein n=1 Tax=Streptomyces marokkonensis TaxID=324855 RepID=A0ABP7R3W9_9ACTN
MPNPITIIQCHRDQGSLSSRAGTAVVTVPMAAGVEPGDDDSAVMAPSPSSERLPCALHRKGHAHRAGRARRRTGRPQGPPAPSAAEPYAPSMRETV